MTTTTVTELLAAEQLAAMGDVGPCELIEGRIVPMTPTGDEHGECEAAITTALLTFVRAHGLGKVYAGEVGIVTRRDPDTVRGADVAYIARDRIPDRTGKYLAVAPDLVVEIVSLNDTWTEITDKLYEYFAAGVRLIWVVHPGRRTVSAYRSLTDIRIFAYGDVVPGDDMLPGLELPVKEIFGY